MAVSGKNDLDHSKQQKKQNHSFHDQVRSVVTLRGFFSFNIRN